MHWGRVKQTYLGFLAIVGEVVETEGAIGRIVLHLQGLSVLPGISGIILEAEKPQLSPVSTGAHVHLCTSTRVSYMCTGCNASDHIKTLHVSVIELALLLVSFDSQG